jgi:hypothetical protein
MPGRRTKLAWEKLQRAGAVQDAPRIFEMVEPREASWTAVALHRFSQLHGNRIQFHKRTTGAFKRRMAGRFPTRPTFSKIPFDAFQNGYIILS